MGEINSSPLPAWVDQDFCIQTGLPKGPLEYLPIPIEGHLMTARSTMPKNGDPRIWQAIAICDEDVADALRFLNEFLPLSGYDILARGTEHHHGRRFGRFFSSQREILAIRRGLFVGRIVVGRERNGQTGIDAIIADRAHPEVRSYATDSMLRSMPGVRWQ